MKLSFGLILVFITSCAGASLDFFDFSTGETLKKDEFLKRVDGESQYVLGEYHYQKRIQKAQSEVMAMVVENFEKQKEFQFSWEFLDHPNQNIVNEEFKKYVDFRTDGRGLMKGLFPDSRNPAQNDAYLPLFEETRRLGGSVIATNAPRVWKREITSGGLSSLDPSKLPPNMELGTDNYYKRFKKVMGGHVSDEALMKYYEAQCYTDSVMAYQISLKKYPLNFLAVGSFHSDYGDGVVDQLKKIIGEKVYNLKFVDANELSEQELQDLKATHKEYGNIGNFLVIIR